MELLVLENDKLVKYNVKYNEDEMNVFLRNVINKYGTTTNLLIKLSNEDQILDYCDEYSDLRVIKKCVDNSKIHKGRKRVTRKPSPTKYLYSLTAIYYPEIYFTILKFLELDSLNFDLFSKYIEPFNNIDYNNINYYIEDNYERHGINDFLMLKRILKDNDVRRAHINVTISNREQQGKCLKDFYNLFTFNIVEEIKLSSFESLDIINALYEKMNHISSMCGYIGPADYLSKPRISNLEISHARKNSYIMEKNKQFRRTILSKSKIEFIYNN